MSQNVDFRTQWLNDLNRAAEMGYEVRMFVLRENGDDAYQSLLRAAVELDKTIKAQRNELSARCEPWFK